MRIVILFVSTLCLLLGQATINGTHNQIVTGASASSIGSVFVTGTPSNGQTIVASSSTAATWQTLSGSGLSAPLSGKPCLVGAESSGTSTVCAAYFFVTGDISGATDSTAALNTLLATYPAGQFILPPTGSGYLTFGSTVPVVLNRNQSLWGDGGGTVIHCANTGNPSACIINGDTTLGPNNYGQSTNGNMKIVGSGPTNTNAACILIGGDPAGVLNSSSAYGDNVTWRELDLNGCWAAFQYGNNAYEDFIDDSTIQDNYYAIDFPSGLTNSGEAMVYTNSRIFGGSQYLFYVPGEPELMLSNLALDGSSTVFYGPSFTILASHLHLETFGFNPNAYAVQTYGSGNVSIQGMTTLFDQGGTLGCAWCIYGQGGTYVFSGVNIYSLATVSEYILDSISANQTFDTNNFSGNYAPTYGSSGFEHLRVDVNTITNNGQGLRETNIQAGFQWPGGTQVFTNPNLVGPCDVSNSGLDETATEINCGVVTINSTRPFLVYHGTVGGGLPALPACSSSINGQENWVSDATTNTYYGNYTPGGSIQAKVMCQGASSQWVTH